jgi:hypothetical protein
MRVKTCLRMLLGAASLVSGFTSATWAVPYASGVRNISGTTWEFILNDSADGVTVLRDGGNAQDLGALAAGRHTFNMDDFDSFSIEVSKSAPAAWTSVSDLDNPFAHFTIPSGLAINKNPASPYFGTVYVASANPAATKSGRAMGDGIYSLTADMKGVDLANNFAAVADPNDTTQAKHPGFDVSGSTSSSPWRMSFDASDNLLISDWSDLSGGLKYASPNLMTGGRVLAGVDFDGNPVEEGVLPGTGPAGGIYSQETDEFGRLPLHGSVAARVYSTGSVGTDLTVWTMDEDLDVDLAVPNNDTNSIWRYDVGSATNYNAMAPTLVVNSLQVPTNSDGSVNLIGAFGPGVSTGMLYSERYGHWYLNQPRSNGDTSAGVAIIDAALDGSDADEPTLLWSSIQFTIDNNLDGDLATDPPALADPNSDVFRRVRDLAISPDGKYLVLHKNGADSSAHLGMGDGAVFLVPLDENGIPDITVENGMVTNVINLTTLGDNGAHNSGAQVEFDAAGNLYVANSSISTTSDDPLLTGQLVQVFSPGGDWKAITNSNGTFSLVPLTPTVGVPGDYNNDGTVDAADYVVWRDNPASLQNEGASSGVVDEADYEFWRSRFGATSGSGSAHAAVPEPAALLLCLASATGLAGVRRKR